MQRLLIRVNELMTYEAMASHNELGLIVWFHTRSKSAKLSILPKWLAHEAGWVEHVRPDGTARVLKDRNGDPRELARTTLPWALYEKFGLTLLCHLVPQKERTWHDAILDEDGL